MVLYFNSCHLRISCPKLSSHFIISLKQIVFIKLELNSISYSRLKFTANGGI